MGTTTPTTAGTTQVFLTMCDWEIDRYYSYAHLTTGECVNSPTLYVENNPWILQMYPNGRNESSQEYVSMYLRMTNKDVVVKARFTLSLINSKNEVIATTDSREMFLFNGTNAWGNGKFLNKSSLFPDRKKAFTRRSNDKITVWCEITKEEINAYEKHMSPTVGLGITNQWEAFDSFDNSEKFSDVKFIVENQEIHAHKIILANKNEVFAAMFSHEMKENRESIVTIEDISYEVFRALISFIYTGRVELTKFIASDLLKVSDKYRVLGLKEMCEKELCKSLSINNVFAYLDLADMYDAVDLKRASIDFLVSHAKEIIDAPEFDSLKSFNTNLLKDVFSALLSCSNGALVRKV